MQLADCTDEQRAVLERFRVHVDSCEGCQQGPLSMCREGKTMASAFGGPTPDEIEAKMLALVVRIFAYGIRHDFKLPDDKSTPQGGE